MFLLLLSQFFMAAICQQEWSQGFYFAFNDDIVYKDEVLLVTQNRPLVQCLLQCKRHGTCHDVAMDTEQRCLLLRDGVRDARLIAKMETVNATRVSAVSSKPSDKVEDEDAGTSNVSSSCDTTAVKRAEGKQCCWI